VERVLVSLPKGIKKIISELKGKLGESESEIIRTIVIAYLSEKGFITSEQIGGGKVEKKQ